MRKKCVLYPGNYGNYLKGLDDKMQIQNRGNDEKESFFS